jgi:hypothetical protein
MSLNRENNLEAKESCYSLGCGSALWIFSCNTGWWISTSCKWHILRLCFLGLACITPFAKDKCTLPEINTLDNIEDKSVVTIKKAIV